MTFFPEAPDSWQASDGLWYAPDLRPALTSHSRPEAREVSYVVPFRVADAYRWSWRQFRHHLGMLLSASVLCTVGMGLAIAGMSSTLGPKAPGAQWSYPSPTGFLAATFVVILAVMLFQPVIILIVHPERTPRGTARVPRSPLKRAFAYLGAAVFLAVVTTIGSLLCLVPGIVVWMHGFYFGWFLLTREMGPFESLRASFSMVFHHIGTAAVMATIGVFLLLVGGFTACVGLLVTLPLVSLSAGYTYLHLQHEPILDSADRITP